MIVMMMVIVMIVIVVVESVGDCHDDDGEMMVIMIRGRCGEGRGWGMMGKGKLWEAAIAFK